MEKFEVSIQDLYDKVWVMPLTKLAESYDVTFHELKSICTEQKIPLPKTGYWTSIRHGKVIAKTKLPGNIDPTKIVDIQSKPIEEKLSEWERLTFEIENNSNLPLKVTRRLTNPHPLIQEISRTLLDNKYSTGPDDFVRTSWDQLNVKVSNKQLGRAMRFLNSLFKLLEARGYEIVMKYQEANIRIGEDDVEFRFAEKMRKVDVIDRYGDKSYELRPTGLFKIMLGPSFHETIIYEGNIPFEDQLARILAKVELLALKEKKDRIARDAWHKKYQKKLKKEKKKKDKYEKELKKLRRLISDSKRWKLSNSIKSYILAFQGYHENNDSLTEKRIRWISWASDKCDSIDPLIKKEDMILDYSDFRDFG